MSLRLMIPSLLGQMIANPGLFEKQFIDFLEAAGYDTKGVAKTIGKMELYHFKEMSALQGNSFFTGTYVENATNVPGSDFVRPKGEHFVIYGIKIEEAAAAATFNLCNWTAGADSVYAKNANISVKINGVDRLIQIPLSSATEDLTTADKGIIMLDEPIIWGGEVKAEVVIGSRDRLVVGAAQSWVRVTLVGIGLFS